MYHKYVQSTFDMNTVFTKTTCHRLCCFVYYKLTAIHTFRTLNTVI